MTQNLSFYCAKIFSVEFVSNKSYDQVLEESKKILEKNLDDDHIEENLKEIEIETCFGISASKESLKEYLEEDRLSMKKGYSFYFVNESFFKSLKVEIHSTFCKLNMQKEPEKLFQFVKWYSAVEEAYVHKSLLIEAS